MGKVNPVKEIRAAFEAKGYETATDARIFSPGEIWYRHKSSTESLVKVVNLDYKPYSKAYSVHVGVFNPVVKTIVFSKWDQLRTLINPLRFNEVYLYYYCWHKFDAGRASISGGASLLPDPLNRDSWRIFFDSLFLDFIDKYFSAISDDVGIFRLLMRADKPFEWFFSNPVLRAAEIVVLGKVAGMQEYEIAQSLIRIPDLSAAALPEFENWHETVDSLIDLYY